MARRAKKAASAAPEGEGWAAWNVERRPVAELLPYARNARTHSEAQVAQVAASIREFGWTMPILVDEEGTIIAGHGRVMAARLLDITEVPVITATGWSETKRRAYCLLDNRVPMNAGWDEEILAAEVRSIEADLADGLEDFDIGVLGFTDAEIHDLTAPLDPEPTEGDGDGDGGENDLPPIEARAVTARGEVWMLGGCRVMCGDSCDAADVKTLFAGDKPEIMVTDPPYGVEYDPEWRNEVRTPSARVGKVKNDDRADWREAWALFPGAVAYVWHASAFSDVVMDSLRAVGLEVRQQVIWAKSKMALGRSAYHWKHEPCWYAVRKGETANWKGGRKQTTLWTLGASLSDLDDQEEPVEGNEPEDKATIHGTQKPVELMRRSILNHTDAGGVVYDPFLGSGSTLIAAQTSTRVCLGMELDPVYVDLIVRRWQAFTGHAAKLEGDGRTFDEVAAERA